MVAAEILLENFFGFVCPAPVGPAVASVPLQTG